MKRKISSEGAKQFKGYINATITIQNLCPYKIKTKGNRYSSFSWQKGYGVFSVSQSKVKIVLDYILKQKEHHKSFDFKEELLKFLKKYDLDYDEKYLWD